MATTRQLKVGKIIQKELSDIIQKMCAQTFKGAFITVTNVYASPDLSLARVYLSFLLVKDKNAALDMVRGEVKSIRMQLGTRVRNQLRIVPELAIFLDDSAEYAQNMDKFMRDLGIPFTDPDHNQA